MIATVVRVHPAVSIALVIVQVAGVVPAIHHRHRTPVQVLIGKNMLNNIPVLGYTELPDGTFNPIVQPNGMIYTQAFITCRECDKMISAMGGPAWNSICLFCWNKLEPNK